MRDSQEREHDYQDLIRIFDTCFAVSYRTLLQRGGDEPIYLPAKEKDAHHLLYFAQGFFSSALHECAHWLIAGEERRKQVDFGYWYLPDGRNTEQQALFQQMEIKPQAMEWILSVACGYKFHVSTDNLQGGASETKAFEQAIYNQVLHYLQQGLSPRAKQFREALCAFYKQPLEFTMRFFPSPAGA